VPNFQNSRDEPFTINQFSSFQNALKLTYGNVEFKKFPGEDPRTPRSKGREREGGKSGRGVGMRRGRGGEGREGR
jgi:hypothetical protein